MCRVGQNRICTPYMTVCMVISLLIIPYIHRIYIYVYGSGQPYLSAIWLLLYCPLYLMEPEIFAQTSLRLLWWRILGQIRGEPARPRCFGHLTARCCHIPSLMCKVGLDRKCVWCVYACMVLLQISRQECGRLQRIYTVLANPTHAIPATSCQNPLQ